jgi:hypothetical protein
MHKTKQPVVRRVLQSDFYRLIASALPFSGKCHPRPDVLGALMIVGLCVVMILVMRFILAN